MTRKTLKHDIPQAIIGMNFKEAKTYCLSEGYQLAHKLEPIHIHETYVITVEINKDNKIVKAKYGY